VLVLLHDHSRTDFYSSLDWTKLYLHVFWYHRGFGFDNGFCVCVCVCMPMRRSCDRVQKKGDAKQGREDRGGNLARRRARAGP
jgi:hypothetical protein